MADSVLLEFSRGQLRKRMSDAIHLVAHSGRPSVRAGPRRYGLTFITCGHRFAVAIEEVIRVTECPYITPLPFSPSWVCGVANVEGRVVTIYDLERFLGASHPSDISISYLLMVSFPARDVGILVPPPLRIKSLAVFRPQPQSLPAINRLDSCLSEILDSDGEGWMLLGLRKLVADKRFCDPRSSDC